MEGFLEFLKEKKKTAKEKVFCAIGAGIGTIIGNFRLFIAKRMLNNIGNKFDRQKDEWVRILSVNKFYNENVYLETRDIFCDKLIKDYFHDYLIGEISYKEMKYRKEYILENLSKIYKEIL